MRQQATDLWGNDDITVAARPVTRYGRVAKVSLITVPHRDRSILRPQPATALLHHVQQTHQVI